MPDTTFALHYLRTDGQTMGPVRTDLGSPDSPDFTSRHATTARRHAADAARLAECDVLVVRVIDEELRPAYILQPDGIRRIPTGMEAVRGENCIEGLSDRACFCSACRARRREARRASS